MTAAQLEVERRRAFRRQIEDELAELERTMDTAVRDLDPEAFVTAHTRRSALTAFLARVDRASDEAARRANFAAQMARPR